MVTKKLKAPFPAFGGKSKVARLVWDRLGDVDNYIEPFCNSAAVLLARHRWLVLSDYAAYFRHMIRTDPTFYDVRVAGYWCWGACCWIGSGWCSPEAINTDGSTWQQKPQLSDTVMKGVAGDGQAERIKGLWEGKRPRIHGGAGADPPGVHSNMIAMNGRHQLADAYSRGRGVNGHDDAGTCEQRRRWLVDWFCRLRDRLRTVRVCCGDWIRVCDSPSTTTRLGLTGIFLDPPYRTHLEDGKSNRSKELYASDRDQDVNALVDRVIAYCLERGGDKQMRLAVCCYEGEGYEVLADSGWTVEAWKASGGYGNQSGAVNENAGRERIWFSPHCVSPAQKSLWS